jgi:hypothetical protein
VNLKHIFSLKFRWKRISSYVNLLLPTLIPLSGIDTTMLWSDSLFLRPAVAWRQPSLKLEWALTSANAAGTNSLTCLQKHGGAWNNKFWSPILWLTIENVAKLPRSHAKRNNHGAIELLDDEIRSSYVTISIPSHWLIFLMHSHSIVYNNVPYKNLQWSILCHNCQTR